MPTPEGCNSAITSRSSSVSSITPHSTWSTTNTRTNRHEAGHAQVSPQKSPSQANPPAHVRQDTASDFGSLDSVVSASAAAGMCMFSDAVFPKAHGRGNTSVCPSKRPSPIHVSDPHTSNGTAAGAPMNGEAPNTADSSSGAFTHSMGHMMGLPALPINVAPSGTTSGNAPGFLESNSPSPGVFPLFRTIGLLHEAARNEQSRVEELIAQKIKERDELVAKLETLAPPPGLQVVTPDARPLISRCAGRHLDTEYGLTEALIARCIVVIGYWERVVSDINMSYCSIFREIYHVMGSAIKKAGVVLDAEQQRVCEKMLFGFSARHVDATSGQCPMANDPNSKPPLSIEDFKKALEIPGLRERLATLAQNATGLHHGLMTFHQGILCPVSPFLLAVPMLNDKGEHMQVEYRNLKLHHHSNIHGSTSPEHAASEATPQSTTTSQSIVATPLSTTSSTGSHHHPESSKVTTTTEPVSFGSDKIYGITVGKGVFREPGYELKLTIPSHFRRFLPNIPLTDDPDCTEFTTEASVQAAIDELAETSEEIVMLHALRFVLEHSRIIAETVNPLLRKGTARLVHYSMSALVNSIERPKAKPASTKSPPMGPTAANNSGSGNSGLGLSTEAVAEVYHKVFNGVLENTTDKPTDAQAQVPGWATEDLCCYIQILSLSGAEVVSKLKQSFFRSRRKMAIIRYNQRKHNSSSSASSNTCPASPNHSRVSTDYCFPHSASAATVQGSADDGQSPPTPASTTTAPPHHQSLEFSSISECDLDGNDEFSETMKLVAKVTSMKTPNPEFLKAFYQDITAFQGEFQRLCEVMSKYLVEKQTDSARLLHKVKASGAGGTHPRRPQNGVAADGSTKAKEINRLRLQDIIPSELFAPVSNSYFQRIMIRSNREKVDMLLRVMSSDLGDSVMPCPLSYVISQSLDRYSKLVKDSPSTSPVPPSSPSPQSPAEEVVRGGENSAAIMAAAAATGIYFSNGGGSTSLATAATSRKSSPMSPNQNEESELMPLPSYHHSDFDEGKKIFGAYVHNCDPGFNRFRSPSISSADFSDTLGGQTAGFSDLDTFESEAPGKSPLTPASNHHSFKAANAVTAGGSNLAKPSAAAVSGATSPLVHQIHATPVQGHAPASGELNQQGDDDFTLPVPSVATANNNDEEIHFEIPHLFVVEASGEDEEDRSMAPSQSDPPVSHRPQQTLPSPPSNGNNSGSLQRQSQSYVLSPFHAAMAATGMLVPPSPSSNHQFAASPTTPVTVLSWNSSSSHAQSVTKTNIIGQQGRAPSSVPLSPATNVSFPDEIVDDDDDCLHSQDDPLLDDIYRNLVALDDDEDAFSGGGTDAFRTTAPARQPHSNQQPQVTRQQLRYTLQQHQAALTGHIYTGPIPAMTREQYNHITAAMAATGIIVDRKKTPSYAEAIASISATNASGAGLDRSGSMASTASHPSFGGAPSTHGPNNGSNLLLRPANGNRGNADPSRVASTGTPPFQNSQHDADPNAASLVGSVAAAAGSLSWYEHSIASPHDALSDSIASWARESIVRGAPVGGASSLTDIATSQLNSSLSSCGGTTMDSAPPTPTHGYQAPQPHQPPKSAPSAYMSQLPTSEAHYSLAARQPQGSTAPAVPPPVTFQPPSLYGSQPSVPSYTASPAPRKGASNSNCGAPLKGPVANPALGIKSMCTKASLAPSFGRSPMTNPNAPEKPPASATPAVIPTSHVTEKKEEDVSTFTVTSSSVSAQPSTVASPCVASVVQLGVANRASDPTCATAQQQQGVKATPSAATSPSRKTSTTTPVGGAPNFGGMKLPRNSPPPPFSECAATMAAAPVTSNRNGSLSAVPSQGGSQHGRGGSHQQPPSYIAQPQQQVNNNNSQNRAGGHTNSTYRQPTTSTAPHYPPVMSAGHGYASIPPPLGFYGSQPTPGNGTMMYSAPMYAPGPSAMPTMYPPQQMYNGGSVGSYRNAGTNNNNSAPAAGEVKPW